MVFTIGRFKMTPKGPSWGLLEPNRRSNITDLSNGPWPSSFSVATRRHPVSGERIGCAHLLASNGPFFCSVDVPSVDSDATNLARKLRQSSSILLPFDCLMSLPSFPRDDLESSTLKKSSSSFPEEFPWLVLSDPDALQTCLQSIEIKYHISASFTMLQGMITKKDISLEPFVSNKGTISSQRCITDWNILSFEWWMITSKAYEIFYFPLQSFHLKCLSINNPM
jgi:hypothetical protein